MLAGPCSSGMAGVLAVLPGFDSVATSPGTRADADRGWRLAVLESGRPTLWQDEAQSALISRTVLQTGLPLGTDGKNFFSQEQGAEYADGHLWRWHTWLPFYMVAGAFHAFGESAWSARLPGAIWGWLTIMLVYRVAWEMWRDRRTALAAAGLLSIHVGMILLSRQCRYYSALSFFTVVSLWGYWRILQSGAYGRTLLVTGMVALFHTHYVYTVICGAAFLTHTLCCCRGTPAPRADQRRVGDCAVRSLGNLAESDEVRLALWQPDV